MSFATRFLNEADYSNFALFTIRQGIDEVCLVCEMVKRRMERERKRERGQRRGRENSVRQLNAKMLLNIISGQQWATIMWAPLSPYFSLCLPLSLCLSLSATSSASTAHCYREQL